MACLLPSVYQARKTEIPSRIPQTVAISSPLSSRLMSIARAGYPVTATFARLMEFRQLLPEPATVEIDELLGSVDLTSRPGDDRPYTIVNFVASVDGRATLGG